MNQAGDPVITHPNLSSVSSHLYQWQMGGRGMVLDFCSRTRRPISLQVQFNSSIHFLLFLVLHFPTYLSFPFFVSSGFFTGLCFRAASGSQQNEEEGAELPHPLSPQVDTLPFTAHPTRGGPWSQLRSLRDPSPPSVPAAGSGALFGVSVLGVGTLPLFICAPMFSHVHFSLPRCPSGPWMWPCLCPAHPKAGAQPFSA